MPGYNGMPNIKMEDGMSHPMLGGVKVWQINFPSFLHITAFFGLK